MFLNSSKFIFGVDAGVIFFDDFLGVGSLIKMGAHFGHLSELVPSFVFGSNPFSSNGPN